MLEENCVERRVVDRQVEHVAFDETHAIGQPAAPSQILGGFDEARAEVDARDVAAERRRKVARRPPDAAAGIEDMVRPREPGGASEFAGGEDATLWN